MLKKRLLAGILAILMSVSIVPCVSANETTGYESAWALYELGLFNGTSVDENGYPVFELDRAPTRHEAVAMLVRLLGKEYEAVGKSWEIPFVDVADWARPYVGYAYANGLTAGTSGTTYSGNQPITAAQYITFVLRALGYESEVDFSWNTSYYFADGIGLTNGQYSNVGTFTRGDVVDISYQALQQTAKGTDISLIQNLHNCSSVNDCDALSRLLTESCGITYFDEFPYLPEVENINIRKRKNDYDSNDIKQDAPYWSYSYTFDNEHEGEATYLEYIAFLRRLGYSIEDTSTEYRLKCEIYIPEIKNTVEVDFGVFIQNQVWNLGVRMERDDVRAAMGFNEGKDDAEEKEDAEEEEDAKDSDHMDDVDEDIEMYRQYSDVPDYASVTRDKIISDLGNAKAYFSDDASRYVSVLEENGYTLIETYTEKYQNSQLLTEWGKVSLYRNSNGREVHLLQVLDEKISLNAVLISIDEEMKKPMITSLTSECILEENPYENGSCVYKWDDNNYEYGCAPCIYSSPIYVRKENVESVYDFGKFLEAKYKMLYSPMEDFDVDVSVLNNSAALSGLAFTIQVDISYASLENIITMYNFDSQYGYEESEKKETIAMIETMMRDMYNDALDCFENPAVRGCIFVDGYHYPHIKVDYYSDTAMSWDNSSGTFEWRPERDTFVIY